MVELAEQKIGDQEHKKKKKMRAPKNGQMPNFNQFQPPIRKRQNSEDGVIYTTVNPIKDPKQNSKKKKRPENEEAPADMKILTFGDQIGGDENSEIIKIIEDIQANSHFDFEFETYLETFKKLEKYLSN